MLPENYETEQSEKDAALWLLAEDKREQAGDLAYNAALERGGNQDECNAAHKHAYNECRERQRQAAE